MISTMSSSSCLLLVTLIIAPVVSTNIIWGKCDMGWLPNVEDSTCVRHFSTPLTWTEIPDFCRSQGGTLVTVATQTKLEFLLGSGAKSDIGYWIDNRYKKQKGTEYSMIGKKQFCKPVWVFRKRFPCSPFYKYLACRSTQPTCLPGLAYFRFRGNGICFGSFRGQDDLWQALSYCYKNGHLLEPVSNQTLDKYTIRNTFELGQGETLVMTSSSMLGVLEYANLTEVPGCESIPGSHEEKCEAKRQVVCEKLMEFPSMVSDCPLGWLRYEAGALHQDLCVRYFHTMKVDMVMARHMCHVNNARLVGVDSRHKHVFLEHYKLDNDTGYWVDTFYQDSKEWSPLSLLQNSDESCTAMDILDQGLFTMPCTDVYYYICEMLVFANDSCPPDWTPYRDAREHVCLSGSGQPDHFLSSAAQCRQVGGHLARPTSQAKYEAIKAVRSEPLQRHYIGMYRQSQYGPMTLDDGPDLESCRWLKGGDSEGVSDYVDCMEERWFICQQSLGIPG